MELSLSLVLLSIYVCIPYTTNDVFPHLILASSPILPLVIMTVEQENQEAVTQKEEKNKYATTAACPAPSPPPHQERMEGKLITLALNLILEDTPRALLLFSSLHQFFNFDHVHQFLIIVPDHHYMPMHLLLQNMTRLKAVVVPESHLFALAGVGSGKGPLDADGYAKQMTLKLLVAQMIETEYYLTLDADVLALKAAMGFDDLVMDQKAMYINER